VVYVVPGGELGTVDGVRLHPIWQPRSRALRLAVGAPIVLRAALQERAALYHLHDPELLPVGLVLRCLGRRVVYDAHEDLAAQIQSKHWVPHILRKPIAALARGLERFAARLFSGVVAAGEDVARAIGSEGVVILRNYPLLEELPRSSGLALSSRAPQVVHIGGLSRIRASRELIQAIGLVPDELNVRLVLAGSFARDGLEAEVRQLPGWDRVSFLGWSSRAQIGAVLADSRIGIVLFRPEPNHFGLRSNKVFEYMAAGLPIIGPNFPAWRALLEGESCGLAVDPTDSAAIADAIMKLLRDPRLAAEMGARGAQAVRTRYNWERESAQLLSLYHRLLPGGPAPVADRSSN
jgi:glycosyltransferase involved in cell wall biosynthesis